MEEPSGVFLFWFLFVLINIFICIFYFYYFFSSFAGWCRCYKGKGWVWRDWEMSGIGVHDVKFPKSQLKKMFKMNKLGHLLFFWSPGTWGTY